MSADVVEGSYRGIWLVRQVRTRLFRRWAWVYSEERFGEARGTAFTRAGADLKASNARVRLQTEYTKARRAGSSTGTDGDES